MIEWATCIGCDQVKGARMAVSHLIEMGHRRIAFISGHWHAPVSHERCRGYTEAMEEAGLPIESGGSLKAISRVTSGVRCMDGSSHSILDLRPSFAPPT